ncbi:hypothetical protein NDU88_000937 [Pleurodeles waltl]|uniref:Uncharacterized protein n=1 Tax=Pleurodeles waltl TaxID=8319 RepID=A0AAV7R6D0_PLEWA|nr:hypothetical protein NDU88_000937 [Pleurodeles waltl]
MVQGPFPSQGGRIAPAASTSKELVLPGELRVSGPGSWKGPVGPAAWTAVSSSCVHSQASSRLPLGACPGPGATSARCRPLPPPDHVTVENRKSEGGKAAWPFT